MRVMMADAKRSPIGYDLFKWQAQRFDDGIMLDYRHAGFLDMGISSESRSGPTYEVTKVLSRGKVAPFPSISHSENSAKTFVYWMPR